MMNFLQLRTFLWVVKLGGFRRAAEKLHTSQPAVSARIASLEDALGVVLLERGKGELRLTAKGRELASYAERALVIAETIKERVGRPSVMEGVLRIGVSETIVHSWLANFLAALRRRFPKVDVEIAVDVSLNLRNDLVSRAIDLALLMGPISEYSVANLDLEPFELGWYVGRDLHEENASCGPEKLLQTYPILTYARNTRPFAELNTFLMQKFDTHYRLFPSTSLAASLHMTIEGVGIGTLPRLMAEKAEMQTKLFELPLGWQPKPLDFTASYVVDPSYKLAAHAADLAQIVSKGRGKIDVIDTDESGEPAPKA